jgi:hypothetical protein
MTTPFVFVTTHSINDGKLSEYLAQHEAFTELVREQEPHLLHFGAFMNQDRTEVTFLFVFADAESAETHLKIAHDKIAQGLEITRTARLEVFGQPGPMLQQVLRANGSAGVPVSIKAQFLGGYSRAAA